VGQLVKAQGGGRPLEQVVGSGFSDWMQRQQPGLYGCWMYEQVPNVHVVGEHVEQVDQVSSKHVSFDHVSSKGAGGGGAGSVARGA
jgi:hypothetical protein